MGVVRNGPRLILSPEEVPGLRERARSSHARHYTKLAAWLDRMETREPPDSLWDLDEPDYSDLLEICFTLVVSCGVAYHVDEDDRRRALAEKWLERWSGFGPASGDRALQSYLVAFHVMALAYGLDLLGGDLPKALVERIRSVLAAEVDTMVGGMSTGESGWSGRYHYHDCWVPVFGLGIGCLALLPYVPEAARWLEAVGREVDWIWSIQDADGAWNEGVAPLNYALGPPLFYLEGRKRVFGEDAFDIPWLRGMPRWRAHHLLPDGTYVYLDDSTPSGRYHGETGGVVAFQLYKIAAEFRDGLAQWQGDFESERTFLKDYHDHVWSFLWYDPSVDPVSPDSLPRSAFFPSWGQLFSRSGVDRAASVLTVECCEPGGVKARGRLDDGLPIQTITQNKHAHYRDRGSFTYFAGGHYFLRPSGYFRFDSELKNTLTVDGHGQADDPATGGGVTGTHVSDDYVAARCEFASAYPDAPTLTCLERTVLHAQELDAALVLDRVRFSDSVSHEVTAHFHVGHEVIATPQANGTVTCQAPNGSSCSIWPVTEMPAGFQRVPQPVDPYWHEYLSGYDIPPADLEAMDQVDLAFTQTTGDRDSCEALWLIACDSDVGSAECGQASEGGTMCAWWTPPGGALAAVVILSEAAPDREGPPIRLPGRPGTVYLLGGPNRGEIKVGLEPEGTSGCLLHAGSGVVCRLTEAGTGRLATGRG